MDTNELDSAPSQADENILEIENLTVILQTHHGWIWPNNAVSLTIRSGEIVCLIGESGCGKSTVINSIVGNLDAAPGAISGTIGFLGEDISPLNRNIPCNNGVLHKNLTRSFKRQKRRLQSLLGSQIGVVFQNPEQALLPDRTAWEQFRDTVSWHRPEWSSEKQRGRWEMLTEEMHLDASMVANKRPGELSGGQCQRVGIALALGPAPKLLLCDEPTASVDPESRDLIHRMLSRVVADKGIGILLVTHSVAEIGISDRTMVMLGGKILECVATQELLTDDRYRMHPATSFLLGRDGCWMPDEPDVDNSQIEGCPFCFACRPAHERGHVFRERCRTEPLPRTSYKPDHWIRCWDRNSHKDIDESVNQGWSRG